MPIDVRPLTGVEIAARMPDLARLRIAVFREYPYCYDGDADHERRYLADFSNAPDSALVAAFDGREIVGAATASPMWAQAAEVREPFADRGIETATLFYFGESVLLPEYRGQGVGHRFFDLREEHARRCGADRAAFCAVVRKGRRRRPPDDYRSQDEFWGKRGYRPLKGLVTTFEWKEIGDEQPTDHTMQFWIGEL